MVVTESEHLQAGGAAHFEQIDAPMSCQGAQIRLSISMLGDLGTVFWPGGGWGCGQDREGPLRVEGKLL
jgi:hypothetical protein